MIIINGGTFNFTEDGYTPPSASGTIYNFTYIGFILNQIWKDGDYVYAAHDGGLEIIEIYSEEKIAYIEQSSGFNSVWADDSMVFLGTTYSGIRYIEKTCISGSVNNPVDLETCLIDYISPFGISAQNVRYIHGYEDDYLMCCTTYGVDIYYRKPTMYRSTTTTSGTRKCFMTSAGKFYYTSVSGNTWYLNRVDKPLWNWTTPDYIYEAGVNILPAGIGINDIFITENTASNTIDNTIFIATTSGVYIIDEGNLNYSVYYTIGG